MTYCVSAHYTILNTDIFQMIGHISGAHLNPAITIGALIMGLKSIPTSVFYILGQLIGATMGYGILKVCCFIVSLQYTVYIHFVMIYIFADDNADGIVQRRTFEFDCRRLCDSRSSGNQ